MYHFKFQKILDIQRIKEEKLKTELLNYNKILALSQKQLDRILGVKNGYEKELMEKQRKGVCNSSINLYVTFLNKLEKDIEEHQKEIDMIKKEIQLIKVQLIEVAKRRKMLESLDEKERSDYIKKIEGEELKHIDEIAIHGYIKPK